MLSQKFGKYLVYADESGDHLQSGLDMMTNLGIVFAGIRDVIDSNIKTAITEARQYHVDLT
ncbi:MAG: hypothetical protein IJ730_05390, partial [Alphaproteobacteria bacterium]|nr:hypothetical protein [Alphaproteobacteria bacterium]